MNTIAKEFSNLIPNRGKQSISLKSDTIFVTHKELSLVYVDIKDDIQNLDRKFSLEFANVRKDICTLDDNLTKEIRSVREESHREMIEVKNEIIQRISGSENIIVSLEDKTESLEGIIVSLEDKTESLEGKIVSLEDKTESLEGKIELLDSKVVGLQSDVAIIKNYLFTQLTSDIKTVVKECLAEQAFSQ